MQVHQVLIGASPGDAVTEIALAIDDLLSPIVSTSIWAYHLDPRSAPRIKPVWHMASGGHADPNDVIIYHCSIGEPLLAEMMLRRPERLVVHYHNITPSHFFDDIDPDFARLLACGRSELRALIDRSVLVLADSSFNADEVRRHSAVSVRATPPPIDHGALTRISPHEPTMRHFAETVDVPMILHVGQLLPHKRPDALVAAMHVLTVELGVGAAMVLVGHSRNDQYARAIERFVEDLGLTNVWLAGECTPAELAAFFRSASLFATASEHEGFCLPVVEAFSFGLPVVARSAAALPETVGAGGFLLPGTAPPSLFAETFAAVLASHELRDGLRVGREQRLEELSVDRTRATMLAALGEVLAP